MQKNSKVFIRFRKYFCNKNKEVLNIKEHTKNEIVGKIQNKTKYMNYFGNEYQTMEETKNNFTDSVSDVKLN
jgi:hypothetical protein